ncbi:sce7725 family protein [Limibacterium fermenti]|uniref:sce7725 family protein n=1 Tax=Limibacterium fermenti TaxID=3229863 RepID=UPI003A6620CB
MYYPYLRARQFELIALRELVQEGVIQNYVTPVLEPVNRSTNNLDRANKIFFENNFSPYLIMNSSQGDFQGDANVFLDYMNSLENCSFLPAFHFTNNSDYIRESIHEYDLKNCMLICMDGFIDDPSLRELCADDNIGVIMLLDPGNNRRLDSYLKGLAKTYIRLDDVFEKQVKNADYLQIPAHKLTEAHLFYNTDGYSGFSDFTILPKEFTNGGLTPRAVVIHLTYINEEEESEIWIRHFTSSTDSDSIANVQQKFEEAALKALRFCDSIQLNNSAISELREYCDGNHYPGLGMVKKISIKNHLIIVSEYLKENEENL